MTQSDQDADLIKAYLQGDQDALGFLYARHIPGVFNFISRLAPRELDAEDVVQESFIKAWRNLKRFDQSRSFKTWLFTIAKNTLLDRIKAKKSIPFSFLDSADGESPLSIEPVDDRPLPDAALQLLESDKAASDLLDILDPGKRAVVVMHVLEDLSFRQIGEVLGEPLDTVKTRYRRAILALAKHLKDRPVTKDLG